LSTLKVILLGSPKVTRDDAPVFFPSLKAQALFYYLITTRQPHTREKLATFFWGDTPERQAKASLRTALYDLRRTLEPTGEPAQTTILTEGGTLCFNQESDYWFDVEEFEKRLQARGRELTALREAVELYQGDFLEGFSLRDSYEFDDWSFFERDRLQREYLGALQELSRYHGQRGDYDQAIAYTTQILSYDSLQEDVHRQLMRLYYAAGNRSAALRQYEICKEILERELDISPLAETTELYEQILRQELAVPPKVEVVRGPPPPEMEPPLAPPFLAPRPVPEYLRTALVGREEECARLAGYLAETLQGRGRLVFVVGEVGIGKTRLVHELIEGAGPGLHLLMGRCYEAQVMQPYQPLVEALRSGLPTNHLEGLQISDLWLREVSRLVPELGERLPDLPLNVPLDATQERSRLFEGVTRFLIGLSRQCPTILFLDDLHWADQDTLQLLHYLARNTLRERVLLLGAYRDEEAREPLTGLVRSLKGEGLLSLISLRPLTLPEITIMIRGMAGMTTGGEKFSHRIHGETEGNPFFTMEVIRSLFEEGVLQQDEHGWTTDWEDFVTEYTRLPIPASVREVVQARLSRLDEEACQILETASVTRHHFYFATVSQASGREEEKALDAFDRLLGAQLIREVEVGVEGSKYDFSHELIREVAYQSMSGARRQWLHRRVGEALEAGHRDRLDEVVDRLAYHFAQGGVRDKALPYSIQAGNRARKLYANEKAIEHYQRALQLAHGAEELSTIYEGLGDVYTLLGKHERAIESYQAVLDNAYEDGGRAAEIRRKMARVYERSGRYDLALRHLQAGKELLATSEPSLAMARLDDGIALIHIRQGRYQEAIDLCRRNLAMSEELAREGDTRREMSWAHNTLGSAYLYHGDYERAIEHFQQSLTLKEGIGDTQGRATLYNNLGVVHYYRGDYDRAYEYYQRSFEIKKKIGDIYGLAISRTNLGLMLHHRRKQAQALRHLEEAVRICRDIEAEWLLPEAYRIVARVYLTLGDVARARIHAQAALETAERLGCEAFIGVAHRVLGQVAAPGRGEWERAEEHFTRSIEIFESLSNEHELGKTYTAYGLALKEKGDLEKAREQLARAMDIFARSNATGRLERVREAYESIEPPS
jgi:DNA-binding SARP family transcriptional activator/Flp pilus assembly protein TadD